MAASTASSAAALALLALAACRAPEVKPGVDSPDGPPSDSAAPHTGETGAAETAETGADSGAGAGEDPAEPRSLFRDDVVAQIALTLDDEALASLSADPRTYVEATFTHRGVSVQVGVRLKGYSSFQTLSGKPNFRVSFDHYVDGQRYRGLEAVDLVSEAEDPAAMSEAIAYRLFREGGQPASRTGFAWVTLNDTEYGLFTLVEKKDDVLIDQWWPGDDEGSLYESSSEVWPCDLDDGGASRCDCWEQDEVGDDDSRADLEALCALATDTPDAGWREAIGASVDWEKLTRHAAMEILLGAYDHYAGYMGNVYLYHAPEADRWYLIPASMNSVFESTRYVPDSCGGTNRPPTAYDGGLLVRRCWDDEACADELTEALGWAVSTLEDSDILAQIDAWEALLQPYAEADPRSGYGPDAFTSQVSCIRDWLAARPAALAPYLPVECLGEGGSLDVSGLGDLSTNGSCDRDWPDAVVYPVATLDGETVGLGRAPDGLEAGDEVLLLVAQGAPGGGCDVGRYSFADVATVSAEGVTLAADPGMEVDVAACTMLIQRVPHYEDVTVRAGGLLTTGAWDGAVGGVLALRVAGALRVEAGGEVSVSARGYAGGGTGESYNVDGYQGESVEGLGLGGASSAEGYNEANGAWAANGGGGGCNIDGGGGEHAGGATAGTSWDGVATAPEAGETYGADDLSRLTFGSGGGGVVNLGGASGPGGAGGGLLFISAGSVTLEGAGALTADGGDGDAWTTGSWTYSAGGGAGGSLWVQADTITAADGAIRAGGGQATLDVTRPGGDGGDGRLWLECDTLNGEPCSSTAGVWAGGVVVHKRDADAPEVLSLDAFVPRVKTDAARPF